jgi:oxaloacetate decarboxylase alpha subunit
MGYPPLVTPTSQIVGSQATLNVLTGERYKIITKETRQCVLGNYGKLPAPISEELMNKVSEDGKVTDCRPADLLDPEWDTVCKELGDAHTSEEDRLTYALFPKVALNFFETRGKPQPKTVPAQTSAPASASAAPVATTSAPAGSAVYSVRVNGKDYTVEVSTGGAVGTAPAPAPIAAPAASTAGGSPLLAPLPGSIFSMKCKEGDAVNEGDTVLVMESMKMESEVTAHQSGTIQSILVKEGDNVQTGDELVVIG